MEVFKIILIIFLIALIAFCVYSVSNANKKLVRLRRRYDYLLRGRGELNLEELIVRHGEELEEMRSQRNSDHNVTKQLESRVTGVENGQGNLFEKRYNELAEEVSLRLNAMDADLGGRIKTTEQELRQQVNRLDETVFVRLDDFKNLLQKSVDQLVETTTTRFTEEAEERTRSIKKIEENNFIRFGELTEELKRQDEAHSSALLDSDKRIENRMDQANLELKAQLSQTLQKVYLYRYNAFSDLTGDQSFTLVLLDENGTGTLLTSIYSRQGSSFFAKKIVRDQPQTKLSPEEDLALKRALSGESA